MATSEVILLNLKQTVQNMNLDSHLKNKNKKKTTICWAFKKKKKKEANQQLRLVK